MCLVGNAFYILHMTELLKADQSRGNNSAKPGKHFASSCHVEVGSKRIFLQHTYAVRRQHPSTFKNMTLHLLAQ